MCGLAALCVVTAALSAAALSTATLSTATLSTAGQEVNGRGQRPGAGEVWKDPNGNLLPFQTDEEVIEFLRTAEIESIVDLAIGITNPRRAVLHKDGVRMRAALRNYDETFTARRINGVFYTRLRDSYEFDIAAYGLARVIGLNHIPPVTLRRIGINQVSLQAWLEGALMESDRATRNITPPSLARFRQQMQDMRVFDSVIGNVDRNTEDIIYGLCRALVGNYLSDVGRGKDIKPPIVFQGGVAFNHGMVRALEEELGSKIIIPAHPEIMGAAGAALLIHEEMVNNTPIKGSQFRGFAVSEISYNTSSFECPDCSIRCQIAQLSLDGQVLARRGGSCDLWEDNPLLNQLSEEKDENRR